MRLMNPFKYGTFFSGKDFCGRITFLMQITGYIESSQHIVILGERRVGKSSVAYESVFIIAKPHVYSRDQNKSINIFKMTIFGE